MEIEDTFLTSMMVLVVSLTRSGTRPIPERVSCMTCVFFVSPVAVATISSPAYPMYRTIADQPPDARMPPRPNLEAKVPQLQASVVGLPQAHL